MFTGAFAHTVTKPSSMTTRSNGIYSKVGVALGVLFLLLYVSSVEGLLVGVEVPI